MADLIVKISEGEIGPQGRSAYEVAKLNGYTGTESEWLATLKGDQGIQGPKGDQGIQGVKGDQGIQGAQGIPGPSNIYDGLDSDAADYALSAKQGKAINVQLADITKHQLNKISISPLDAKVPYEKKSTGHLSVVYCNEGFCGYKYIMAHTPYPPAGMENPCIEACNNGFDWETPAGLTNPIFEAGVLGFGNNSDVTILLSADKKKLLMYWRGVKVSDEAIFYSETADLIHWTTPILAVHLTGANNLGLMSPAVIIEDDGSFVMWSTNLYQSDKTKNVEKRVSADGKVWGDPVACNVPPVKDNGVYHLDVKKSGGKYYMLALIATVLKLRFLVSDDGVTWVWSSVVPLSGANWDKDQQYRSSFVVTSNYPVKMDIWVTGIKLGTSNAWADDAEWSVGYYKNFELNPSLGSAYSTLPHMRSGLYYGTLGTNSNLTPTNGNLLITPIFIDRKLTIESIGLSVITAGSAGSVMRLGIWADDGNSMAESLILDAGTIDATTTGYKSITINKTLEPGWYWIGAVLQGNPSTKPVVRGCASSISIGQHDPGEVPATCYRQSNVTDAFAGYFNSWATDIASSRVLIKIK